MRRMVAGAVCKTRKEMLRAAAGPHQYGVGLSCGLEALHKAVSAEAEQAHDLAFVSLDLKSAFTRIHRRVAYGSINCSMN